MSFCGHLCQKKRIPGKTLQPQEILRLSAFIDQERQRPGEKPNARHQNNLPGNLQLSPPEFFWAIQEAHGVYTGGHPPGLSGWFFPASPP